MEHVGNLMAFFMLFVCNANTMQTALGNRCEKVVEKYAPSPVVVRSSSGTAQTGELRCRRGGELVGNECVLTRIVAQAR